MTREELQARAAQMYVDGQPLRAISAELRVSFSSVRRMIKSAGVEMRPNTVLNAIKDPMSNLVGNITQQANYGATFGEEDDGIGLIEGDLRDVNIYDITSARTGIICDVHMPFHALKRGDNGEKYGPYMTALEYLKEQGCTTILLNGDFMDCYQLSRHEKVEQKRNFAWELDVVRGALRHLRQYFGDNVRIIYREGNHEERLPRILATKLPELQGLISLPELLKLSELNIEWVGDRDRVRIGQLWVDHGHEWFGSGGVNPARAYRMKAGDNVMVGHVHRTTYDNFKRPLDGTLFAGWTVGCLCDLTPHYASRNHWNHGVAIVHLFDDGEFMVDNRIIFNNRIR